MKAPASDASVTEAARFLEPQGFGVPTIGMVLGSGFGRFAERLDGAVRIPYKRIPHFPVSTVTDHAGNLVAGRIGHKNILVMQGRIHCYEGYTPSEVTFPIRVMKQLGIATLIVTNAAGGLNHFFTVGDLMLIEDHINMMGVSLPAIRRGLQPECQPFYAPDLHTVALSAARRLGLSLRRGILVSMLGPSFETPAEIAMLRQFGADAVSMSTVPEVVMAHSLGLRILGVSCISNLCVGGGGAPVKHEDVMAVVSGAADRFSNLISHILEETD